MLLSVLWVKNVKWVSLYIFKVSRPFLGDVSVVSFLTIDLLLNSFQVPFRGYSVVVVAVVVFCLHAASASKPSAKKGSSFMD